MAPITVYIVTANCGRDFVDRNAFAEHFYKPFSDNAYEKMPDFIVLSLQEMAPMAYCFLGGSYLKPYFNRIEEAVYHAAPETKYKHVITRNAGMTGMVILAKPDIADRIRWTETAEVGVGVMEAGNKGAVGVRLGYAANAVEYPFVMTFVAAHLAAGEAQVERRNKDWENIVRGLVFEPIESSRNLSSLENTREGGEGEESLLLAKSANKKTRAAGMFDAQSVLFFAGDLNYRTSDTGPGEDDHISFPQPVNDTSDPKHYSQLLRHDQLTREVRAGKTLQHLSEAAIDFPPTYKYAPKEYHKSPPKAREDTVEPDTWRWAPHRYPSWCDRVLFSSYLSGSSGPLKVIAYTALPIQPTTDHRPVGFVAELNAENAVLAAKRDETGYKTPFPLNPRWREQRSAARTKELIFGLLMYLGWTWEGNGIVFATIIGAVGSWLVLRTWMNIG